MPARTFRARAKSSLLPAVFLMLAPANGWARSNGVAANGCEGCHAAAPNTEITFTPDPERFEPGAVVTFRVTIEHAGLSTAGLFVPTPDIGQLRTIEGEGLKLTSDGFLHSAPKAGTNGSVSFRFGWQAPAEPGAVHFEAYAVASNNDRRSSGDTPGSTRYARAFGCEARTYFFDADRDGFGALDYPTTEGCTDEAPEGYSLTSDDCDDTFDYIHPGAPERCNEKDDNCNQVVDEDADPVELWPDADGDGYAAFSGESVIGCVPLEGYAAERNDCDDNDPKRHPNAVEVCNLVDDDCDGRTDERVRPQCGEGWCLRDSVTCSETSCTPGTPLPETCNLLDDDCDGEVDEDSCGPSAQCVDGACMSSGSPEPPPTTPPNPSSTGGATSPASPPNSSSGGGASTPPASPSPSSGGSPAPAASPSPSSASGCAFSPARFDASSLFPLLALALLLLRRRQGSAA
jgi:MYXO-CTERM domain-containing protein